MSRQPAIKPPEQPHTAISLSDWPSALAGSINLHVATKAYGDRVGAQTALDTLVARLVGLPDWHIEFVPDQWSLRNSSTSWVSKDTWGTLYATPRFTDPADLDERRARAASLLGNLAPPPLGELRFLALADWVAKPLIDSEQRRLLRLNSEPAHSFDVLAASFEAIRCARHSTLSPWLAGDFPVESELEIFRLIHDEAPTAHAYALAVLTAGQTLDYVPVTEPRLAELVDDLVAQGLAEMRHARWGAKSAPYVRRSIRLARRSREGDVLTLPHA